MWLLIGWQFAAAELVGGAVMIALLTVLLPRVVSERAVEVARARLAGGEPPEAQPQEPWPTRAPYEGPAGPTPLPTRSAT